MYDDCLDKLAQVANEMNRLAKSSDAIIHYDLLAGALWWSDERPSFSDCELHSYLRPVFRYRTTLILDTTEDSYTPLWEASRDLFPFWPGFAPERCSPNEELAQWYRKKNRAAILSFELLDILYRTQEAFNSRIPSRAIERRTNRREMADLSVVELHDMVCRYLRRTHKAVPVDSWERVCRSVSESTGVPFPEIGRETWLAALLKLQL